jgi:hypothetical protein
MVTQLWDITPQPEGYLSKELDQVAKGWPGCLKAMAAVNLLVPEAQILILNHPLMVYTPHDLGEILNSKGELWLSDCHLLKYQAQLMGGTEITLRTCQGLNPFYQRQREILNTHVRRYLEKIMQPNLI